MAATENKFRAETASRSDLGRSRSAGGRALLPPRWPSGQELGHTGIGPTLLLPRAPVAARPARHIRVECAAV